MNIPDLSLFFHDNNVKIFEKKTDIYDQITSFLDSHNEDAFYIVDLSHILHQFLRWKQLLPNITPYYAMKCNPNPIILRFLALLGCGFDCASREEISAIKEHGVNPEVIIYANPCKESGQIKYARSQDVDILVFDDVNELYKIKLYHPYAKLVLRIATDDRHSKCRFSCKFGCSVDEKTIQNILSVCKALNLKLCGVSFHVGSGCQSVESYRKAIQDSAKVFQLAEQEGFHMYLLDIGGGFPGMDAMPPLSEEGVFPTKIENPNCISFETIALSIRDTLTEVFPSEKLSGLQLIAEPGRYFVSGSHTLCLNVISKKERFNQETKEKEFTYYMNEGVYGSFNCIFFDHAHPDLYPYNERDGTRYKSTVFGPTCDSMDIIHQSIDLPELAIGEWCFVPNFGAYTLAAASNFNGFQKTKCFYVFQYPTLQEI